ncbi:hypothetical protein MSMEG_5938 [Mycolicibacterium smegmatis MC2 155]|uniref:Uncharacterized protein n=1 Tax=Mycolicibacterium smegmatis (strain ATCC 700084 / mc(2)155) TaxID=246196 RepID=A0R4S4_MYCS2|nr:hypothetical protein MSMEG_5938 [Mycolicibacterium smegmatis MC2 155]
MGPSCRVTPTRNHSRIRARACNQVAARGKAATWLPQSELFERVGHRRRRHVDAALCVEIDDGLVDLLQILRHLRIAREERPVQVVGAIVGLPGDVGQRPVGLGMRGQVRAGGRRHRADGARDPTLAALIGLGVRHRDREPGGEDAARAHAVQAATDSACGHLLHRSLLRSAIFSIATKGLTDACEAKQPVPAATWTRRLPAHA